ncbi:MAG TPA: glycoside hydrolase family 44 protein [Acidobacteriaceae bacterium]|nr:glycoside hydrolase family 44 protein [Acidobacteriaceae bacterium]
MNGVGNFSTAVNWSVSPSSMGTISSAGVFTPATTITGTATATITATSTEDTAQSGSATVTVTAAAVPPTITSVTVTVSPTITTARTAQATATVQGTGAYSSAVTWSVSPSTIGTISSMGLFTPATTGTATITATSAEDATKYGSAQVTVTAAPPTITGVTVTPSTATIGTFQLFTATVNGTGSYNTSVTWSVTGPAGWTGSIGSISSTGLYETPYPAPATVTVRATSVGDTSMSGSATVTLQAPATAAGPALTVDATDPLHAINPLIYGMNGYAITNTDITQGNIPLVRWGGDDTSRYNYQTNVSNSASDWYFENGQGAGSMPGGGDFTNFVSTVHSLGAEPLGTVPVLGWVSNSSTLACSFTEAAFPGQQSYLGDCGNGIDPEGVNGCATSGGCDLYGNNTIAAITSIAEPPPANSSATLPSPSAVAEAWAQGTWTGGWVNSLVTNASYGPASGGTGVNIWDLDNEPAWWDAVHRDVHPSPSTYDEVTYGGISTALAIKTIDPSAQVSGPVIDYWWNYFYSKQDIENGWSHGPCYQPWDDPTDREAHGGVPMIEYYLQQFAAAQTTYGIRLLDYVDIHGYDAATYNGVSVDFTTAGDTGEQEARINSTRVLWDPTYTDPNEPQPNYITDMNYTTSCDVPLQAPELIPMLEKWVANDYPGTKTAIDEYNWGGLESISGALTQADVLGIFGQYGLDLGALWGPPTASQVPGLMAFEIYRNYDGHDSTFGDTALASCSGTVASACDTTGTNATEQNQLAVYGALRSSDNALTVVVINKTYGPLTSTLSLEGVTATGPAAVYQYSNANLNAIAVEPAQTVAPPGGGGTTGTISYTFPAQSITLFIIPQ